jgi:hypothetical protein
MEAGTQSTPKATAEGQEFPPLKSPSELGQKPDKAPDTGDPGRDALQRVAKSRGNPSGIDVADATAWFLSDEDTGSGATKDIEINVGRGRDHFVTWTVQSISRERIRQIRRDSRITRGRQQTGEIDEMAANLGIAAAGTIVPDLTEIAAQLGTNDTADVLRKRLAHKPGLIDAIAAEVLTVSGYDDNDVRDVAAGKP